jgi:hypothetical protein
VPEGRKWDVNNTVGKRGKNGIEWCINITILGKLKIEHAHTSQAVGSG